MTDEGETSRMRSLQLDCIRSIGPLRIEAPLDPRDGDALTGVCVMMTQEDRVAARMTAWFDILR